MRSNRPCLAKINENFIRSSVRSGELFSCDSYYFSGSIQFIDFDRFNFFSIFIANIH